LISFADFFAESLDGHDLVVLTVHDQSRDIELPEVFSEVGFRKGLDAVVGVLEDCLCRTRSDNGAL
jgi:hypothetical protein